MKSNMKSKKGIYLHKHLLALEEDVDGVWQLGNGVPLNSPGPGRCPETTFSLFWLNCGKNAHNIKFSNLATSKCTTQWHLVRFYVVSPAPPYFQSF